MYKCANDKKSYPQICAQNKKIINNPHVNKVNTHKVIHILTELCTILGIKFKFRIK